MHPAIEFSMYVAPRENCASQLKMKVAFPDGSSSVTRYFDQNNNKHWHRFQYRHLSYIKFPSHVTITLEGKGEQDEPKYSGSKFGRACLQLVLTGNDSRVNDSSTVEIIPEPEPEHDQLESTEQSKDTKRPSFLKRLKAKIPF